MTRADPAQLFRACWQHADDERITRQIDQVHNHIAESIRAQQPACESSGRCCHFNSFDHHLYTTALEAAYTIRSLKPGTIPSLANARLYDACPFLSDNLCSIHTRRPAGCRIFFCDPNASEWMQSLYEHIHVAIKELHNRHHVPYLYIEWRSLLEVFDKLGLTSG